MSINVLVIEDDEITILFHQTMLKNLGCNVIVATSGEEGINLYQNNIDIILMDIGLPGIDGFKTFKEIKRKTGFSRKTMSYACTAFGKEVNSKAKKIGMDGVITKPCTQEVFKKIINLALKKRVKSEREVLPLRKEATGPARLAQL